MVLFKQLLYRGLLTAACFLCLTHLSAQINVNAATPVYTQEKALSPVSQIKNVSERFAFINPHSLKDNKLLSDTISVNNVAPFNLSWNWIPQKPGGIIKRDDPIIISGSAYLKYGVHRYSVELLAAKSVPGRLVSTGYTHTKLILPTRGTLLSSNLTISKDEADKIGLKDKHWYKAVVKAFDSSNKIVVTDTSVDYMFRKVKDEEQFSVTSVNAVVKYAFKGFPEQYKVANTPVSIEVFRLSTAQQSPFIPEVQRSFVFQTISIGGRKFERIASAADTTDSNGLLNAKISIPQQARTTDSLYYRLKIKNAYYISDHFPLVSSRNEGKETTVSFGPLVANTYGYSLKVFVNKAYTQYKVVASNGGLNVTLDKTTEFDPKNNYVFTDDGMIYKSDLNKPVAGVTMVLYRKQKKEHIPAIEGNLKLSDVNNGGTVEVSRGITVLEKNSKGVDVSFVKFERLLANLFQGDEYYMIALNDAGAKNSTAPGSSATMVANQSKSVTQTGTNFMNKPYDKYTYQQKGFEASEQMVSIPKPVNLSSADSLYRNFTAGYHITSTKPPTSVVKGRLLYQWKSDISMQLRPVAKQKFKVVVDYLVNDKTIESVVKKENSNTKVSYSEKVFIPEGATKEAEGMQLLDFDKTVATGETDAEGNFTIEVVNLNQKGLLGKGKIGNKGWSLDVSNVPAAGGGFTPGNFGNVIKDQHWNPPYESTQAYSPYSGLSSLQSQSIMVQGQSNINAGMQVQVQSDGSFQVLKAAGSVSIQTSQPGAIQKDLPGASHGPNTGMNEEPPLPEDEIVEVKRVFRIVPDNKYLYRTKETFVVQPFQAIDASALTSFVKEFKLSVTTVKKSGGKPGVLTEMMVTVFRTLDSKAKDLPMGEGDNKYVQKKLINPEANLQVVNTTNANELDNKTIMSQIVEYIQPSQTVDNNGRALFTGLLGGFDDYYVQATSNPDQGSSFYKATFSSVFTEFDEIPEFWNGSDQPNVKEVVITLEPLDSRMFFSLVDNSGQQKIPYGKVRITKPSTGSNKLETADADGNLELKVTGKALAELVTQGQNTLNFNGEAPGYNASAVIEVHFTPTGFQRVDKLLLDPAGKISGQVVNADKPLSDGKFEGVPSYLRLSSGKIISTDKTGKFTNEPIPASFGTKIEVMPTDIGFFNKTLSLSFDGAFTKKQDFGDIKVNRRQHRIRFVVKDKDTKHPVANVAIQLGSKVIPSDASGTSEFAFENVSVNNYTFVVRGPQLLNYIPVTKNVKNEESADFKTVDVLIERGSEVNGQVTLDGKVVKNAKVYIDAVVNQSFQNNQKSFVPLQVSATPDNIINQGNNGNIPAPEAIALNNDANLIVAYTDETGQYTLHGIPVKEQKIDVLATLDTNFTVSGDRKITEIKFKQGVANLALTSFKDMTINSIYGFPLSVEKIQAIPGKTDVLVTGIVHWTESISHFELDDVNQVIRIEKVPFKAVTSGTVKFGIPIENSVVLDGISSLKLRYKNRYNVKLSGVNNTNTDGSFPKPLLLEKENDHGVIRGFVNIVDNSFNYPGTYLNFADKDGFYLAEKTAGGSSVSNNISAVKSAVNASEAINPIYQVGRALSDAIKKVQVTLTQSTAPVFFLSTRQGDSLAFKFLEFPARASALKSFIDANGKIHLNVRLNCFIKNAQPENISVTIDDIVLDQNNIEPAKGKSAIEVDLEKWKLRITEWKLSALGESGITSNNGLIMTSKLDIPFAKFVLRHDMFIMEEFNTKDLKLGGGIVALTDVNNSNAGVVFDNKAGSDMQPHWRFSISGTGAPIATLKDLPDLNGTLGFNYIQVLSNDEHVFQLQPVQNAFKIRNNANACFTPQSIFNGPGYFNISGALNVGAPRVSDMLLRLNYSLEPLNPKQLKMKTGSVESEFEGKGFVHFTAKQQGGKENIDITPTTITISGEVEEKDVRSFNPIPAEFKIRNEGPALYAVELLKGFPLQLNSTEKNTTAGYKLTIDKGGMEVTNGDWSLLTYEGLMTSNAATSDNGIKPTYMTFTVLGDVTADASKVEMEGISTPFGAMKMVYDFSAKRLTGTLNVKDVQMGTNTINGVVETVFDPKGFYVAGGGEVKILGLHPFADGTYNLGFMVGSYPLNNVTDQLWQVVNAYKQPEVNNDCYVTNKANGKLKGFYMSVDRIIVNETKTFDFILVAGYVEAKVIAGIDMWANFSDKTAMGIGIKLKGKAAAGMDAITGTSIQGSMQVDAGLLMQFIDSKFSLDGTFDMSFTAKVSQSLLVEEVSVSKGVGCSIKAGTGGFSLQLNSGPKQVGCY